MTSGIYLIRCDGNGVLYVGQSANIEARWARHQSHCREEKSRTNRRLHRSAQKYGVDSLTMSVLEACPVDSLTEREQFWVDAYRKSHGSLLVNSAGPADNPTRGVPKTPEQRAALSAAKMGKPNPSARGDANPSRRPEFIARMTGAGNPAKRPEVRRAMSERSGAARAVVDVATGKTWRTMSDCATELGVSVAAVHAAATKKNRSVRGLVLERAA